MRLFISGFYNYCPHAI